MPLHPIHSYQLAKAIMADRHRAAAERSNSPRQSTLTQREPGLLALEREIESHHLERERVRDSLLQIPR